MVDREVYSGSGTGIEIILVNSDQPSFSGSLMTDFMIGVQSSRICAGKNFTFRSDKVDIFFTDILDCVDNLGSQIFLI